MVNTRHFPNSGQSVALVKISLFATAEKLAALYKTDALNL